MVNMTDNNSGGSNRSSKAAPFAFEACDVTSTRLLDARNVQRATPAGSVARALAAKMDLPDNVPWTLRNERGVILDEARPIGDQLETGERVTVTPKTHLGGAV